MFQIHKYDPRLLKPLAKLAEEPSYARALMRMEQLKNELTTFCEMCLVDPACVSPDDDGIFWRSVPCLYVVLEAVGNPDLGQHGTLVPRRTVAVRDLAHASEVCMAFIDRHGLGSGNWSALAGSIMDIERRPVGKVSYNGKVWEPGQWSADKKPVWPPPSKGPTFPKRAS